MSKTIKKILIIIIIIVLAIVILSRLKTVILKKIYPIKYAEIINKYSLEYEVDPLLVLAIIKAESNFKEESVSTQKAVGLMQLMDSTAEEIAQKAGITLTEENILEPETNINIGTKYISNLLKRYECTELALAAYNAGSGNVDKWIKNGIIKADGSDIENIPYKETNTYVRKIMRDYKIYMELEK